MLEMKMGLKCGAKDPELRGVAVAAFFSRGALHRSTNTNIALRRLGRCLRACSSISVQSKLAAHPVSTTETTTI
jgi:hypothetical protein